MPTKHKFYRSKRNGRVCPAMSSPEGYEDKHPEDWEPATREEFVAQSRRSAAPIESVDYTVERPEAPAPQGALQAIPAGPAPGTSGELPELPRHLMA